MFWVILIVVSLILSVYFSYRSAQYLNSWIMGIVVFCGCMVFTPIFGFISVECLKSM